MRPPERQHADSMTPWIDRNQGPRSKNLRCGDQRLQNSIANYIGDNMLNPKLEDAWSCCIRRKEQRAEIQIVPEYDIAVVARPLHDGIILTRHSRNQKGAGVYLYG
jgi:hypothetical protein